MPDHDSIVDDDESVSRRDFFTRVGVSACAVAAAASGVVTLDYLKPKVLFEPPTSFIAGTPLDYADGVVRLPNACLVAAGQR